ncbi:MAG: dual specificity protein phosphatase family protein [Planctomycetes bacterium]|nr:dual specificity protein phosphatase family protein [Planctomycetota bacterium]
MQRPARRIHRITDRLFLGGEPDEAALPVLRKLGVKNILSLAAESGPLAGLCAPEFRRILLPVYDCIPLPVEQAEQALRTLRELEQSGRTLVHCIAGVSRSPAIMALFLVASGREGSMVDALRRLRLRRPVVNPSPALLTPEVVAVARRLRLEWQAPETSSRAASR